MGEIVKLRNIQVSVSGGRTSGYMAWLMKKHMGDYCNLIFTFANTSAENEETLRFTNAMDREFGLNLVWLEAKIQQGRKASTYTITSYERAKRNGEVFHAMCEKYGLPNQTFRHCTREMKRNPLGQFGKDYFRGTDFEIAIGIRADENRRVSPSATEQRIIYPLVDIWPTNKAEVKEFFSQFAWDLQIPEHQGNCVTCFQKSDKKLNQVWRETPEAFALFAELEDCYSEVGPNNVPGPRKLFRGRRSTRQMIETFQIINSPSNRLFSEDDAGGCSESCELFETEVIR